VLAVAAGVAVAALSLWVVSQRLFGITTGYVDAGTTEPFGNFVLRHWLHASLVCGLGTAVYVARKRGAERLAALRALQIQTVESAKLLLKTRLTALQARVEPRFLLDTLARVELLYEHDLKAGDRLLERLVSYLRAALPHMPEITSTLGREMKIAEAYLALQEGVGSAPLRTALRGTASEHTSLPPMLLLPLIEHALIQQDDRDGLGRDLAIQATLEAGRLRIAVHDSSGGFAPDTAVSESSELPRERLQALYADTASLAFLRTDTGSAAVIDLPEPTA
jgi:LytS/YehU family sensor histidine kinase